jgi:acetylornithine deacetylase/succinyl-diaminopimelate desuccinylase-like protein
MVTIEADEESGSGHIDSYLSHLSSPLSQVDYVVCLDSGVCDYDRLWLTTSLRGNMVSKLSVQVLQ